MVNLGVMGHFVGDNSQPFHSTADYDGYKQGHGGIHGFYEDQGVDEEGIDLTVRVEKLAAQMRQMADSKDKKEQAKVAFLAAATPLEKMRALSSVTVKEINPILALDPVTKPSHIENVDGRETKTPAERKPISAIQAKFSPLIVTDLARSTALLAELWDEAYAKAGKPDLSAYRSWRYPLTPEFVAPDYFDIPKK